VAKCRYGNLLFKEGAAGQRESTAPPASLFRRKHHQHLAAFHARMLLHLGGFGDIGLDPLEKHHA
jgi:hypothetical protein